MEQDLSNLNVASKKPDIEKMSREEKVHHGATLLAESVSETLSAHYSDSAEARSSEIKSARIKESKAYELLANGTKNEIEDAFSDAVSKYNPKDGQLISGMKIDWQKVENAQRAQLQKDGLNVMTIEQEQVTRNAMAEGYPLSEARSIALDGKDNNNAIESEGAVNTDNIKYLDPKFYEKFQIKDTRRGKEFYWKDSDKIAFKEKGDRKLITESNSKQVAESIVEVAESRGWESIKVSGNERFRQLVWMEANLKGMDVAGYKPSEQDLYELEQRRGKGKGASLNAVEDTTPAKEAAAGGKAAASPSPTQAGTATKPEAKEKASEKSGISEQDRQNYKLLKEIKEDEHTAITQRSVGNEKSVTLSVRNGEKNERYTFSVDEQKGTAKAAVLHVAKGEEVEREVVSHQTTDKAVTKRIEAGLRATHDRQAERDKETTVTEELNNDKAPYQDDVAMKKAALSTAYRTLTKEEAVQRHPELSDLYKLEHAATELANNRIGNPQSREDYVKAITDRSLNELAKGNEIPKITQQADKSAVREMAKGLER